MTIITQQTQWATVAQELEAENLKLASYDNTLLTLLGTASGRKILDYGCGPGVLASALFRGGAHVQTYDLSPDMRKLAGLKIGLDNVYDTVNTIPVDQFDVAICNLVLCIVDEDEVKHIAMNLARYIRTNGKVYIGFCNPKIYNIPESRLDLREQTSCSYEKNHQYKKVKKEGGYKIMEDHRPIEWYERVFANIGLTVVQKHFTPEYKLKGNRIQDFIIFELKRQN